MFSRVKFLLLLFSVFGEAGADTGGAGGSPGLDPSNAAGSTGSAGGYVARSKRMG